MLRVQSDDAAVAAGGIGIEHAELLDDVVGIGRDLAAVLVLTFRRYVDNAAVVDRAARAREKNEAALAVDAAGFDHALVVDHAGEYVFGRGCGELHRAAVRFDGAGVADRVCGAFSVVENFAVHPESDQAVAVEVHRRRCSRGQGHVTQVGDDLAFVFHRAADQGDEASGGGVDQAAVDHRTGGAVRGEEVQAAGHEIFVADIKAGGEQSAHVYFRGAAEDHAGAIEDEHLTVGLQLAEDLRRVAIQHAVQNRGGGGRLIEADDLVLGDVEGLPVDGEGVGLLLDDGGVGVGGLDLSLAGHHGAAARTTVGVFHMARMGQQHARGNQQATPHQARKRIQACAWSAGGECHTSIINHPAVPGLLWSRPSIRLLSLSAPAFVALPSPFGHTLYKAHTDARRRARPLPSAAHASYGFCWRPAF